MSNAIDDVKEVHRLGPSERVVEIDNPFSKKKGYKRERYGVFGGHFLGSQSGIRLKGLLRT